MGTWGQTLNSPRLSDGFLVTAVGGRDLAKAV